jgi:1-acyl-sn-glycerol-3-phosphate acyltransferase
MWDKRHSVMNRDTLVDAVLGFIGEYDLLSLEDTRAQLQRVVDDYGHAALEALHDRLTSDDGWSYYAPDPISRRIHHMLADRFLTTDSETRGAERLTRLHGRPVVIVANHLSYADANVVDVLLERAGGGEIARRLTALAGPKVFSSRERRFSSLCFGNIKVPQSADVSSGEAVLSAREVARAARHAIEVAHHRLALGDALLLFGEGTRSRTRSLQPMLPGAARYLEGPDSYVLPVGLTGSESIFPIDGSRIRPGRVVMNIGEPMLSSELLARTGSDRKNTMDAIGRTIAVLLPESYRGVYGAGG